MRMALSLALSLAMLNAGFAAPPKKPATPGKKSAAKAKAKPAGSPRLTQAALKSEAPNQHIVIAEGERFQPQDTSGWKVIHQQDSYASHTYGGMWVSQGGLISAPAASGNSVATQSVNIPAAGKYRVWSKYQAPPYFSYLHKIEVVQNGKPVFSHTYGRRGTERLWSFAAQSDELFWFWGVDHDAAEAPKTLVDLQAGPAEIRLSTVSQTAPAGDPCIDFVVLTTNPDDTYKGFKPYQVGSPFCFEALAQTKLYVRFKNSSSQPAKLKATKPIGHFQPNYGGASQDFPAEPVAPGQWSEWFNIGPFCNLVHNEGLKLTLPGAQHFAVQVARDAAGTDLAGDMQVPDGDVITVPLDVTWNKSAKVITSREHAARLVKLSKQTWRTANGGKKPEHILYFGSFTAKIPWVAELKDALGYNTQIDGPFPQTKWHGRHNHAFGEDALKRAAAEIPDKSAQRFISFGDEIGLPPINFNSPENLAKFRLWLLKNKISARDLGVAPEQAPLVKEGAPRPMWYSNIFNEEEIFSTFRANTEHVRQLFGTHCLSGANYSPHHLALCYGPIYQWVDLFKHNGMSMFWGEDYVFSVPEAPQIFSWMLSQVRCGVKYNQQPIHFYIMPHAPGQEAGYLRKNTLLSIGYGTAHIDSFCVGPEENYTENYVAWGYDKTFQALHESFFDSAEAEKFQHQGKFRSGRVAIVLSKATDFNESRLKYPKGNDPLIGKCRNAPETLNQILCRKDQQMLFLALKHAQYAVDLVTEDDIVDGYLKNYDVVYFAGEWVDHRTVPVLEAWVRNGGTLYATAGLGHFNEFNESDPALLKLLGLKSATLSKNVVIIRTLLELPLLPPIGEITLDGQKIPCIGMKQQLVPDSAKVLGTWNDGSAAVTVNTVGKGRAFAVGTLAGNTYMFSGVRKQPWPRGGRKNLYSPDHFSPAATQLALLGVASSKTERPIVCSHPLVEGLVIDHPRGTLVTLVNWSNAPVKNLEVTLQLPQAPKSARSVEQQREIPTQHARGELRFHIDLTDADYVLLPR